MPSATLRRPHAAIINPAHAEPPETTIAGVEVFAVCLVLEEGGVYPVGAANVHDAQQLLTSLLASRLDERGEDALAVAGDAVIETLKGLEILPQVFQIVDQLKAGLTGFLVQNIAVVLDSPNTCEHTWSGGKRVDQQRIRRRCVNMSLLAPCTLLLRATLPPRGRDSRCDSRRGRWWCLRYRPPPCAGPPRWPLLPRRLFCGSGSPP